jgi:hypothetical protein
VIKLRLTLLIAAGLPVPAMAQNRFPPDSLQNIKALPSNLTPREVVARMQGFTRALGVRCPYCHVGEEGQPLASFDFVSDERRNKQVAREMIRMVQRINEQTLARITDRPDTTVQVTCQTCHRGVARPIPLEQIVVQAVRGAGLDSAIRAYRALRTRYFGSDAYDFSERSLVRAAATLAQAREFEPALGLLALDNEFYPRGSEVMVASGDVQRARGDTAAAIRSYREALTREPGNQAARQRLSQLGQQP